MQLPRTSQFAARVIWRDSSPSTNAELTQLLTQGAIPGDEVALLATVDQPAGRGRRGRGWETPPGLGIAASVHLPAGVWNPSGNFSPGWVSLAAGTAMAQTLQGFFPADAAGARPRVGVKWPNDVHVRTEDDAIAGSVGRKLCGVLGEILPGGGVVVGTGINVLIPEEALPTDRAGSLLACGAVLTGGTVDGAHGDVPGQGATPPATLLTPGGELLVDSILSGYVAALTRLLALAAEAPASFRASVLRTSLTIGSEVLVHLPDGRQVRGYASSLADSGELVVELPAGGELVVSAADVEHLR